MVDIAALIAARAIIVLFQPIVSLRRAQIVGYEALARGFGPSGPIPPLVLFDAARRQGLELDLDRLCRELALRAFVSSRLDGVLFLNVDSSALRPGVVGSSWIRDKVAEFGLDAASIVLEIAETHVLDTQHLYDFVDRYRDAGFLIALDDFGAAHSNLDRLVRIEPDIIKVDRGLIQSVHQVAAKGLLVRSLADMCRRLGALGLAEGVEEEDEALVLAHAGFDLFQGYYFGRPALAFPEEDCNTSRIVRHLGQQFEGYRRKQLVLATKRSRQLYQRAHEYAEALRRCSPQEFDNVLQCFIQKAWDVDCLFVTDAQGVQVSQTICQPGHAPRGGVLFRKAEPGTDHGLKDYIAVPRRLDRPTYLSPRYVSYATRILCRTVSQEFLAADGRSYFLCVDFIEMPLEEADSPEE